MPGPSVQVHRRRRHGRLRYDGANHVFSRNQIGQPITTAVVDHATRAADEPPAPAAERPPECTNAEASERLTSLVHDAACDGAVFPETQNRVAGPLAFGQRQWLCRAGRAAPSVRSLDVPGFRRGDAKTPAWKFPKDEIAVGAGQNPGMLPHRGGRVTRLGGRPRANERDDRARHRTSGSGIDHLPDDQAGVLGGWRSLLGERVNIL